MVALAAALVVSSTLLHSQGGAPTRFVTPPNQVVAIRAGRMFDTTIRINNLGFRGPDLPRDKGAAFRIFAVGESQTFRILLLEIPFASR